MNTEDLKKKVIEKYKKKKEEETKDTKESNEIEEEIKNIVNKIIEKKEVHSDSESTLDYEEEDSDENIKFKITQYGENEKKILPYLYIDYDINNINIAKGIEYKTITVEKTGLTKTQIKNLLDNKITPLKDCNIIFNLWRVLTKSNLNSFSYDCRNVDPKKLRNKIETTFKWGSKQYLKETLKRDEQRKYSLFREYVPDLFNKLYNKNVKIFIVCNSHISFVEAIIKHYKLDVYIEAIFTPSKCGIPNGNLITNNDSYKDGRKINKARVFACIERYIGRIPIKYKGNLISTDKGKSGSMPMLYPYVV